MLPGEGAATRIAGWSFGKSEARLTVLPVILLFILFQRQIIQGMTAGALKG